MHLPQTTPEEIQQLPVHALAVDAPTQRSVVDTCIGNDKHVRSVPHWNGLAAPRLHALEQAGDSADSILHADHLPLTARHCGAVCDAVGG